MTSGLRFSEEWLAQRQRRPAAAPESRVRLVLPLPPSVNHSTTSDGRGGRLLTAGHILFRAEVTRIVAEAGNPTIDGRLAVLIEFVPPDRRARDLDNLQKSALDALQRAGVYDDDAQIDDLRIVRLPLVLAGMASATVTIMRIRAAA